MLAEINLLPKKHRKKKSIFIVMIVILLLGSAGIGYLYQRYQDLSHTESQLTNQLMILNGKIASEKSKSTSNSESNSIVQLQTTVNWAENNFIETVPLLDQLSSNLPERGFVQSFTYSEDGTVVLDVQFDSNIEVAQYLGRLKNSVYLSEVTLKSVRTSTKDQSITSGQQAENETKSTAPTQTTTSVDEMKKADEYLPRYIAEFDIIVNKDKLRELQKEDD